jgi:hypothetical protein
MWSITVPRVYVAVTQLLIRSQEGFVAVVGPGSALTDAVGVGVDFTGIGVLVVLVVDG